MPATVLVIEDDETVAEAVRINLTAEGYEVVHAPDGPSGLAAAARRPPDVVLIDLVLPEADSWSVLTDLREHAHPDLPIIVLASRVMPVDKVRGYNLGATAYLNKPFTAGELAEKVRDVVADATAVSPPP